jgi:hypothetical protein
MPDILAEGNLMAMVGKMQRNGSWRECCEGGKESEGAGEHNIYALPPSPRNKIKIRFREMYGNQTLTQKLYGNPITDERRHLSCLWVHNSPVSEPHPDTGSVSNTGHRFCALRHEEQLELILSQRNLNI